MGKDKSLCGIVQKKMGWSFCSLFGMEPYFCAILWNKLVDSGWTKYTGKEGKKHNLLWELYFLRVYSKEEVHSSLVDAYEKDFRRWAWFYTEGVANLHRIIVSYFMYLLFL